VSKRRLRASVLGLTVLATWAQAAAAAPAPLQLSGISPAVADRGGLVTITGNGFGAQNVKISVDGRPADVVSATGSKATFRVPALAGPGDTIVKATNPGGHSGTIALRVRFDGKVAVVADTASAVAAEIGAGGGTLAAAGMTLAIPAGAVPEGTTITATPLRVLVGSPFSALPVGMKLEPSGLVLLRPATLTLPRPTGAGQVVGFGFDGDGTDFHLVPHSVAGGGITLKVWHFSGAGAIAATVAELGAVFDYIPTPAHMLAEQRIATALAIEAGGGAPAAPALFTALSDWWIHSVLRGLQVARDTERLDFFELGFGEWQAWEAYVAVYDDNFTPTESSVIATAQSVNLDVATTAAARIARRVLARCVGPGVPRSALRDVLRLASAVTMAELPIEQRNDPGQRPLPAGGGLPRACLDVDLTAVDHAPSFARNRDNRFGADARVVFWNGPASATIPLRYRLADSTNAPVPVASGTSSTGSFRATVHPGSVGTRHYELTVDLDTGGADDVLAAFFARRTEVVPVRERLDLQARRPNDPAFGDSVGPVGPGDTVVLWIRLAGDEVAAKQIAVTHDASGSVAATATTNASGEAFLTYGAPATAAIELVTATITEAGLATGDAVLITTVAPAAVGVTRIRNRAAVAAACYDGPTLDLLVSAPGATSFDQTLTCQGGDGARSVGWSFFRETIAGGKVTGIELNGLADVAPGTAPQGFATAAGRYELEFTADRSTAITVSGSLSPCNGPEGTAELLLFSFDTGSVVARKTCATPGFRAVLAAGRFLLTAEAVAGTSDGNGRPVATLAYALDVAFSEP
jgi:hypothetical protein